MIFSKPALIAGICLAVPVFFYVGGKIRALFKRENPVIETSKDTVLFFSNESTECFLETHNFDSCRRKNCHSRNIRKITDILRNAKQGLDVCVTRFANPDMKSAVLDALENCVRVRIITSMPDEVENVPEEVNAVRDHGARVCLLKFRQSENSRAVMHRTFAVVDGEILIIGSLNWTREAISSSWEDTAIVSQPMIVQAFNNEFERVWTEATHPEEPVDVRRLPVFPVFPTVSSVWKESPFHLVLMFEEYHSVCRKHMYTWFRPDCRNHLWHCSRTALSSILNIIKAAEKSVSVCYSLLTLEEVACCLTNLSKGGVTVRIITDQQMSNIMNSQIKVLIEQGLGVRSKRGVARIRHKFLILDEHLVCFGSLNWSLKGFCGNYEDFVCTTQEEIVGKFKDHFEELWDKFEPLDTSTISSTIDFFTNALPQPDNQPIPAPLS